MKLAAALLTFTIAAHAGPWRASVKRVALTSEVPNSDAWERTAHRFTGRKADAATLSEAADALLAHYAANDFPAVAVAAETAAGTLTLNATPAKIHDVILNAGPAQTRRAIQREWAALCGKDARWSTLEAALDWLHRNPLHAATLRLREAQDGADVFVRLNQSRAARGSVGWANDGVAPLSENRLWASVEAADVFGISSHVSAGFATTPEPSEYQLYRASLRLFLPWMHEWNIAAALVRAESSGQQLRTSQLGTRYVVPLHPAPGWTLDLGAGVDFRRTNNDLEFGGLHIGSDADTAQLALELKLRHGESGAYLAAIHSPGGWTSDAIDAAHGALRHGAEAAYSLARAGAWTTQRFKKDWSLAAQIHGQAADAIVLPAEQLALGGANAVRGFDEVSHLADSGAWGSIELRGPAFAKKLEPSIFADAGTGHDREHGEHFTIASTGIGLRGRLSSLSWQAQYAWRVTEPGGRVHLSARLDF